MMRLVLALFSLSSFLGLSCAFHSTIWRRSNGLSSSLSMLSDNTVRNLWSERVEYVDLSAADSLPSSTARSLPLFMLGGAFYPQGITYLNVFEMRYRTMMFDCANSDDMFGYIHCDEGGRIASYGTMCKITYRQLLEDGRQYISLEGVSRFKVKKILKTLPYVLAEVEPFTDDDVPEDEGAAMKLEGEVYDCLKYYLRLMKSYAPNKGLVISQSAKKNRPTAAIAGDVQGNRQRRTSFSFSLANMIQMQQPIESQLLLQTTNVMQRLKAEKDILSQASVMIADQLLKMDVLTADARDSLKFQSFNDERDSDILPPDVIEDDAVAEKDEWDLSNIE